MLYTVQPDDSLSKIARDVLRNMSRWPEIAALNKLTAPYVIRPGQVLQLPGAISAPMPPAAVVPVLTPPAPFVVKPAGGGGFDWLRNRWVWIGAAVLVLLVPMFSGKRSGARRPGRRRTATRPGRWRR